MINTFGRRITMSNAGRISCFVLFAVILASRPAPAQNHTFSRLTGVYWKGMDAAAAAWLNSIHYENGQKTMFNESLLKELEFRNKQLFVTGMVEMAADLDPTSNLCLGEKDPETGVMMKSLFNNPTYLMRKVTIDQFANGLDEFYSDYKNTEIRIIDAIKIVGMDITGEQQDVVEWWTRYYRASPENRAEMLRVLLKEAKPLPGNEG
jgi:hypothetical protein